MIEENKIYIQSKVGAPEIENRLKIAQRQCGM